jgi:T5SS/PEP-CTERM-associated repeat protein
MLVILLAWGPSARAVDYTWTGAGGDGVWTNKANWGGSGAPVNAADTGIFDYQAAVPYVVRFTTPIINTNLRIKRDKVVLDMGGHSNVVSSTVYVADTAGYNGQLAVTGGILRCANAYLASATTANGTLTVTGSNSLFISTSQVRMGVGNGSQATLRVQNGASIRCVNLYAGYSGTGVGMIVVSNGTLTAALTRLGFVATGTAELLLTGAATDWKASGAPSVYVGDPGVGRLTVSGGAKATKGTQYLFIGRYAGATGTVTIVGTGSVMGGPEGVGNARSVSIGCDRGLVTALPSRGGVGTLNVLDGGALQGAGISSYSYPFCIQDGSRIRIRDGSIKWCVDTSNRDQPIFFMPGSTYAVELTANSKAFTEMTPLIMSGANVAGPTRTNVVTDAILDVSLVNGFSPTAGDEFHIFQYTGDLVGSFAGLPDGADFQSGVSRFKITYGSRTNGKITLTARPPRGTLISVQ